MHQVATLRLFSILDFAAWIDADYGIVTADDWQLDKDSGAGWPWVVWK
jgi:hypothetical protein